MYCTTKKLIKKIIKKTGGKQYNKTLGILYLILLGFRLTPLKQNILDSGSPSVQYRIGKFK